MATHVVAVIMQIDADSAADARGIAQEALDTTEGDLCLTVVERHVISVPDAFLERARAMVVAQHKAQREARRFVSKAINWKGGDRMRPAKKRPAKR